MAGVGLGGLGGEADGGGVHLVGGLGLLLNRVVLADEYIHRTISSLVWTYDRLLEECPDELHFWIVRVRADDDGLLNLFHGVGRERNWDSFASKRSADFGCQALPIAPVIDPYQNLAALQLTFDTLWLTQGSGGNAGIGLMMSS